MQRTCPLDVSFNKAKDEQGVFNSSKHIAFGKPLGVSADVLKSCVKFVQFPCVSQSSLL